MKSEEANVSVDGAALQNAVVTQVEFYLSDSNLPFDKFLFSIWSQSFYEPAAVVLATPAPEGSISALEASTQSKHSSFHLGWLPLSRLSSFKRMQPYLEAPPKGLGSEEAIGKALAKSDLVEAREFGKEGEEGTGWYVRRTTELARPIDSMLARSVYVKGFPASEKEPETEDEKKAVKAEDLALQQEMEAWAKSLEVGQVKSLRMRRETKQPDESGKRVIKGQGKFKGSIFIEFAAPESVAKILSLEPKPTWKGAELLLKSKADYVEEKRLIYAPDSKPAEVSVPKQPYANASKPFNAWLAQLVGPQGFPKHVAPIIRKADDKKRKAENSDEREVLYDGVRFTAKREGGNIHIVEEDQVSLGEAVWAPQRVLRFTISKLDGSFTGDREDGEKFDFGKLKTQVRTIHMPVFVDLLPESSRSVAALPKASTTTESPEYSTPLTAPPVVSSAADLKPTIENGSSTSQQYPAKGQVSFKETVTDEVLEKLRSQLGTWEDQGRKIEWVRASEEDERSHNLSRARFHAEQAFGEGGFGSGRGGRGGRGRGSGRGARGGRSARGGGGDRNKRPRND